MDRRRFLQSVTLASAGAAAVAVSPGAETPQRPSAAAGQTRRLAEYAAGLRYEDIPADVIQRAKDAIADTVAVATFGGDLPWSRMIAAYAKRNVIMRDGLIVDDHLVSRRLNAVLTTTNGVTE